MNPHIAYALVGLIATSAAAQEVSFKLAPASSALTYTVLSKSEMTTDTKRTINGEERGGRGGGGRTTKSTQKLVFQDGPAESGWRKYIVAAASVTQPTRGGEDKTSKIVGAVAGKKIFIAKKGKRFVFTSDSAEGEKLPRQATTGIPAQMSLAGLLPAKPLEVQGKAKLKKGFARALRKLLHPVNATPVAKPVAKPKAEGDAEKKRGQGGNRGGGGPGGRASTWNASVIRTLGSKKLNTKGTAQLVSVSETDGKSLAVLSIDGVIQGEGTPTELGMGAARRRRGKAGAEKKPDTGTASFTMKITGLIVFDQTNQRIHAVSLEGTVQSSSESVRTVTRNDQERKIGTAKSTAGSFSVEMKCGTVVPSGSESTTGDAVKKQAAQAVGK